MLSRMVICGVAAAVVGVTALAGPPVADAALACELCWPSPSCGLSMPEWTAYCDAVACGAGAACWNNSYPQCDVGYVLVKCGSSGGGES